MQRGHYLLAAAILGSGCADDGRPQTGDEAGTDLPPATTGGDDADPDEPSDPGDSSHPDVGTGPDGDPDRDDCPVIRAPTPPPPISGGTLLVTAEGGMAVIADSDRDRVVVVDSARWSVHSEIVLQPGDWPGRAAEDAEGRIHVALRGPGALVTLDPHTGTIVERRALCPNPRGVVHDPADDSIVVACAGGEIVRVAASDGDNGIDRVFVERDLRDIWIDGDQLHVSRFRSAQVLTTERDGTIVERQTPRDLEGPPATFDDPPPTIQAGTAWRTVPQPRAPGNWLMLHQRSRATPLPSGPPRAGTPTYYGGALCRPVVVSAVTARMDGVELDGGLLNRAPLAVDAALSPDATLAAFAVAARTDGGVVVLPVETGSFSTEVASPCRRLVDFPVSGSFVAVAFDPEGRVLALSREPATLARIDPYFGTIEVLELGGPEVTDTGHDLFHQDPGGGVVCASCHPEGGDDGRTWIFEDVGPRRTPSAANGFPATAPFHWSGDLPDFAALVDEVFVDRMGGRPQSFARMDALADWATAAPRSNPTRSPDDGAAVRGADAFVRFGCRTCHAGEHYTSNLTVALAPDRVFQVPVLHGVAHRAPYMHDGRAADLRAAVVGMLAFVPSELEAQPGDVDDLVAFLETL